MIERYFRLAENQTTVRREFLGGLTTFVTMGYIVVVNPQILAQAGMPVFGVCLGLQGIVEAFGGELGVLDYPMHGKPSVVFHRNQGVFEGLPERFKVGRYHSLFARKETFPACLEVTAESEDGVIMGLRHRELPIEAVQFHPESILTLDGNCGLRLIENMISQASACAARP